MSSKYFTIYKISLSNQLSYRMNFFLGRLRSVLILVLLYTLFSVLTSSSSFGGYTKTEFMTYIFLMHLLRSFIFGTQNRDVAREINDGTFSIYLIRPVQYFFAVYTRELAERCVLMICACIELGIFFLLIQPNLFVQSNIYTIFLFALSVVLAHILYALLSYFISLIAFWSREAMGPRFLFEWFLEFASGVYFPLSILSPLVFFFLKCLPFMYVLYIPIQIYLGKITPEKLLPSIGLQAVWIVFMISVILLTYKKGIKKYSGEGI